METSPQNKLSDAVSERLLNHEATADSHVEVVAESQQVWLRGHVRSQAIKDEAEVIAKGTPGVVLVINELRVRPEGGRGHDDGLNPNAANPPGTTFPLATH